MMMAMVTVNRITQIMYAAVFMGLLMESAKIGAIRHRAYLPHVGN